MKNIYPCSVFSPALKFNSVISPRLLILFTLLLTSLISFTQTTYNFSTPATLSSPSGTFVTLATITVDGVSYKLSHLGNGNFTNQSTGGKNNTACLRKEGSGGDFLRIERADGAAFQFYGMWLSSSSMYNPPYYQPPYYNIKYYDQNGNEITSATTVSNNQNDVVTVTQNLKVKYVYVTYNAIMTFLLDDLIVGPAAASPPSVSTTSINQFTNNSCMMGGNVTDEQLASVTDRGVVYNTTGTPTTADAKVQIGNGLGTYSQTITGLTPGTLYYVRAYATNSAGTTYGSQLSFTTASPFVLNRIHYFNTAWVSTASQPTPFTKYVEGWNITATSTGTGLVSVTRLTATTGTGAVGEGVASARAISSTAAEDLVSMSVKVSDNTPFDLQGFKFKYLTKVANTAFGTMTVTGYRNGTAVPGAVASLSNIPQATSTSYAYSIFDLNSNNNFNNIDQFVITATDPASGARLSAIDMDSLAIAPAATLPVKLESFTGTLTQNSCLLTWTTSQEQNSHDIDIEYSTDGIGFRKIGNIAAAGNSMQRKTYSYTHTTLLSGDNYYRLKMNDADGKYEYSQVVLVKKAKGTDVLNVYPNPVNGGQIFVHVSTGTVLPQSFLIVDAAGKTVLRGALTADNQNVDVSLLKKGTYFIIVSNGSSQQITVQ
ncbi:MAG: T9SS type A sorting domain-containing protein [Williamsia sp.]|nr:T9SS type A sorting domain-containing protein [Williamsia sp.]